MERAAASWASSERRSGRCSTAAGGASHAEAGSEELPGLVGGGERPAGDADRLTAEEERGGEALSLLAEVGGVLLRLQHRPVDVEPGDVPVALPVLLQLGQPLGVGHRPFQGGDAELGGGHLGDALQQIEEALAEQLQRIERGGVAAARKAFCRGPRLPSSTSSLRVKV